MFNSKYPIVALGMNQVSNLKLALAVAEAGAVPTISIFNYVTATNIDIDKLATDLGIFKKRFKNYNFILSVDVELLLRYNDFLFDLFKAYQIMHLEVIPDRKLMEQHFLLFTQILENAKNLKIRLLVKIISLDIDHKWKTFANQYFDGIIIKGQDGAGRVDSDSNKTLAQLTTDCINEFPNKFIIPCGGVGSATEVIELLHLGAGAIGIGTLFAASEESPLSTTAKEQLINSNFANLKKLKTYDFEQSALVFSELTQSKINNTQGLVKGIATGKEGHIFAGKSIDNINEIKSVRKIVEDLCN